MGCVMWAGYQLINLINLQHAHTKKKSRRSRKWWSDDDARCEFEWKEEKVKNPYPPSVLIGVKQMISCERDRKETSEDWIGDYFLIAPVLARIVKSCVQILMISFAFSLKKKGRWRFLLLWRDCGSCSRISARRRRRLEVDLRGNKELKEMKE